MAAGGKDPQPITPEDEKAIADFWKVIEANNNKLRERLVQ